jgi:hypothetical protein
MADAFGLCAQMGLMADVQGFVPLTVTSSLDHAGGACTVNASWAFYDVCCADEAIFHGLMLVEGSMLWEQVLKATGAKPPLKNRL